VKNAAGTTVKSGSATGNLVRVAWDLRDGSGALVPDGGYTWAMRGKDAWGNGTAYRTGSFTVDGTPPVTKATATSTAGTNGWIVSSVKVTLVADRGFCDHKLYRVLRDELAFHFVIRMRANIRVTAANGERRKAADWVGPGGRARVLHGATITGLNHPVGTVVCVHAKGMREPWCLVTDTTDKTARELVNLYAKRWEIECQFRDSKDIRYGMGMGEVHVSTPARRDRLWLVNALAVALLTLLGAAGEALGFDRMLKSNTAKRRTHSLLRQGIMLHQLIPTMPKHRLLPLVEKFAELLEGQPLFADMFGAL